MSKIRRNIILLSLIIIIGEKYYKNEYQYKEEYEILENNDAFARYSDGLVYIGSKWYLENLDNVLENDILIVDERYTSDPNMIIYDSYKIADTKTRNEIIEILNIYEEHNPSNWDRSIASMRIEWLCHNISYYLENETDRTKSVDLNNEDEEKYNPKKVLKKVIRKGIEVIKK